MGKGDQVLEERGVDRGLGVRGEERGGDTGWVLI